MKNYNSACLAIAVWVRTTSSLLAVEVEAKTVDTLEEAREGGEEEDVEVNMA